MGSSFDVFGRVAPIRSSLSLKMSDRKEVTEDDLKAKRESMNKTETKEVQVLPSAEDIAEEKNKQNLNAQIEGTKRESLKKTETAEKVHLPTKEDIEAEKKEGC